jgi:hypothetical protein
MVAEVLEGIKAYFGLGLRMPLCDLVTMVCEGGVAHGE